MSVEVNKMCISIYVVLKDKNCSFTYFTVQKCLTTNDRQQQTEKDRNDRKTGKRHLEFFHSK